MLPPEPVVIDGRQGFIDAQADFTGALTPLGNFYVSWYGTNTSDERGSFAVVHPQGALADAVGDFLQVVYRGRSVNVYVIGSFNGLTTDLGLTRRAYLQICRLSLDPIFTPVQLVT